MKLKRYITPLLLCGVFMLSGCTMPDFGRNTDVVVEDTPTYDGLDTENLIDYETCNGIDSNDPEIDLSSSLSDGEFYVVHDGYYYPTSLGTTISNNDVEQMLYSLNWETSIPTLFLEAGDKLVYYTTSGVVDYFTWTRYRDLGYTTGIYNERNTTSGRYYIYLNANNDDEDVPECITPLSSIYNDIYNEIYNGTLYLRKIGNIDINESLFDYGLFSGWQKNETHDLEVYDGTYYHHYMLTADVHAFQPFEQFASIEYTPSENLKYIYDIEIPDYFIDGYYKISTTKTDGTYTPGVIRIISGSSYMNTPETFNTQILYPYKTQMMTEDELRMYEAEADVEYRSNELTYYDKNAVYGVYSTYDPLNTYSTEVEDSLGYRPPDYNETVENEITEETKQELKDASTKKFPIYFPVDRECTIRISPSVIEASGDIYLITSGNVLAPVEYDRFNNEYVYNCIGDGETYYLYVGGLWHSYDIHLTNAASGDANDVTTTVIDLHEKEEVKPDKLNTETADTTKNKTSKATNEMIIQTADVIEIQTIPLTIEGQTSDWTILYTATACYGSNNETLVSELTQLIADETISEISITATDLSSPELLEALGQEEAFYQIDSIISKEE